MKLLRFLTAISMTLSMVGCCCGRNVISDCNDPCGGISPGQGFLRMPGVRRAFGYGGFSGCGCDSCGGGWGDYTGDGGCSSCSSPMNATYGTPSTGGCNCGSTAAPASSNYPPVGTPSAPTPLPSSDSNTPVAPAPPIPPATPADIPPGGSAMIPPSASPNVQTVSYEEFQRLPGTIISGPGAVSNPAMTSGSTSSQRMFNRPASSPSPTMVSSPGQSPVWVPAK